MNKRPLTLLGDNDTIVECKKCGRREHLKFVNGLKNGWSKCCGYTMTIVYIENMHEVVENSVKTIVAPISQQVFKKAIERELAEALNKEEPWSVS